MSPQPKLLALQRPEPVEVLIEEPALSGRGVTRLRLWLQTESLALAEAKRQLAAAMPTMPVGQYVAVRTNFRRREDAMVTAGALADAWLADFGAALEAATPEGASADGV
jgi:hypothetical protein